MVWYHLGMCLLLFSRIWKEVIVVAGMLERAVTYNEKAFHDVQEHLASGFVDDYCSTMLTIWSYNY